MEIDLGADPRRIENLEEPWTQVTIRASPNGARIEWSWKHRPNETEFQVVEIGPAEETTLPSECRSFELEGEHWELTSCGVWRVPCE